MSSFSRRHFVRLSLMGLGSAVVSTGLGLSLSGCAPEEALRPGDFNHGLASGDPLSDRVILWTRVTPEEDLESPIRVFWQVAKDENFDDIVVEDSAITGPERDFTMKVDVHGLEANTQYFYRFATFSQLSVVGQTKTLPVGAVDQVKFAVVSCSNFPAGYFHVYGEIAKQEDIDVALHLGDYLYEYGLGGYASEDAERLGRTVQPETEILTLDDYRARYRQYRGDANLQSFHQKLPMIAVWDDHEVANNAWREGAANHDEATEGNYIDRMMAALQAYAEWMPIRPSVDTDISALYRSFQFGDLVNLSMLDTRIVGRDRQLNIRAFFNADGSFNAETYFASVNDSSRSLLGAEQLVWLEEELSKESRWQVLGQQVLMGTMELPGAVATLQLTLAEFAQLAAIARQAQIDPSVLTPEQLAFLQERGHLLRLPNLPYNLDAWDGYPAERERILQSAAANNANLVVLAGDTHNAWANNIEQNGEAVAVELATSSVSSPGLESFLGLDSLEAVLQTEGALVQLIQGLQYANLSDRGYLTVTFTEEKVDASWQFIDTVKEENYQLLDSRAKQLVVNAGSNSLSNL